MVGIVITTLIYVILTEAFGLYMLESSIKRLKKNNKELEVEIKLLKAENADFKRQCDDLKEFHRKTVMKPQEEFEADDNTYNRIVSEWIYGAEEEGGIDGEQRNTNGL